MALLFARTVDFTAAILLACVCVLSACSQAGTIPADHSVFYNPTLSPQPSPSSTPTQHPPIFKGPLSVIITQPSDNEMIRISPVEITGQADPGTVVTINDTILLVDGSQKFHTKLDLEPGINVIEITASDPNDHQDFSYLTLVYDPQQ
jgi:hypothetical protein